MSRRNSSPAATGAAQIAPTRHHVGKDVAAFLRQAETIAPSGAARGRLVFALDATMSRQPTWDLACHLQASLFEAAAKAGGLDVKLSYFRGRDEARASGWVRNPNQLEALMGRISCRGGLTQIDRILQHAAAEARRSPLAALVYVGDTMEEDIDRLCTTAGELALRNSRAFMFLEGQDQTAEAAYREIARITGGVFLRFDPQAAARLRALLEAIGTYAAGGRTALEATGTREARELLADLRP